MLALQTLFFLGGAVLATFYPFLSAILDSRGFTPAEIGAAIALTSLAYAVAAPLWGHLGDVVLGRSRALRIASLGAAVVFLALLLPGLGLIPTIAILVAFFLFEAALGPLSDALAVNALPDRRQYPRVRILTSLSFAIAVIALGFVYDRTGFGPVPIVFAIAMAGVAVAAGRVPDAARLRLPAGMAADGRRRRGGSFRLALSVQPRLAPLLLGLGLVHVGILAGFTFLALRILELGGQPSHLALGSGLAAAVEVPAIALVGVVAARIGLRRLIAVGAALYAAGLAAWAFVDAIAAIIAVRALTGVAFAAISIGAVMAIGALLPARLQATGQGMFATVAFGIAAVLAASVGGIVYTMGGHVTLFAAAALVTLTGTAVVWSALPGRDEEMVAPEFADDVRGGAPADVPIAVPVPAARPDTMVAPALEDA